MRFTTMLCWAIVVLLPACSGERRGEDTAPRVARLVCEDGGTRALTPTVQAVSDGVHIEIENESGARQFYLRTATSSDSNQEGRLEKGLTEVKTTMPPGKLVIGCFGRSAEIPYSEVTSDFAEVTIVDPDDLWIPPELPCDEEQQERFTDGTADTPVPEDVEAIVRSAVAGVLPNDELVRPGYPQTEWHGELRHVVRNGSPVASVVVFQEHGRWKVLVRACPGSAVV